MDTHIADIGIVIINYNNAGLTLSSIKTLLKITNISLNYQLVIIDNASEATDYELLAEAITKLNNTHIKLVRSKINTGFGGGNMLGVQHLNAHYYAFINNDTLLQNDCLSILKEYMDAHKKVALCGPQILNEQMENKISFDHFVSVTREVLGSSFLELVNNKKYPNRKATYTHPVAVNYVNGSFMFCRAKDFNQVGGFDTNIFLFFEESDLSYRLLKHKKLTCFVPQAKYIHFQGKSMPSTTATKLELKTSMFYVIRKHYGYLNYQLLRVIFVFRYGLTSLVKPKYWPLFYRILIGLPLSKSIKVKQKIANA